MCQVFLLTAVIAEAESQFPHFRHVDPMTHGAPSLPAAPVRLLADADFPPYNFEGNDGVAKGIAIDLARAACTELRLTCELVLRPYADLVPALQRGDGDIIVTPMRLESVLLSRSAVTRSFYVSTAQFVVRNDSPTRTADIRSLAGLRLGVINGTAHAAFLYAHYSKSLLQKFTTEKDMFDNLKAGNVAVIFGDTMHLGYWLKGAESAGCCRALGRPFVDNDTFSRGASFVAMKERRSLVDAFDWALDRLDANGTTGTIFARYVPAPLW